MTHLFQSGVFRLHSGTSSAYKVECDALTPHDWRTLAQIICDAMGSFRAVEGVPTGGCVLADALRDYATGIASDPLLICDDVLTTGASMEQQRAGREALGVVVFARGPLPSWVRAVWAYGLA